MSKKAAEKQVEEAMLMECLRRHPEIREQMERILELAKSPENVRKAAKP